MTGRMQGRKDAGQEECKQEECRTEWDAERVRCRKVGIFFGLLQWCSGDENGESIAKNLFKFNKIQHVCHSEMRQISKSHSTVLFSSNKSRHFKNISD